MGKHHSQQVCAITFDEALKQRSSQNPKENG